MKKIILAAVLGGLAVHIWGFISWVILPWHNSVANKFTDETVVAQVLQNNASVAGVYYLPFSEQDHKAGEAAAFVNVLPQGFDMNMGRMMLMALLLNIFSAFIATILLRQTSQLDYIQRVGFVTLTGLAIGFISHHPYWNWFGFSSAYVAVIIIDTVITWLLAGLVIAKFEAGKVR